MGKSFANIILAIIREFKLENKLSTITGDSASNNSTLCQALFLLFSFFLLKKNKNVCIHLTSKNGGEYI